MFKETAAVSNCIMSGNHEDRRVQTTVRGCRERCSLGGSKVRRTCWDPRHSCRPGRAHRTDHNNLDVDHNHNRWVQLITYKSHSLRMGCRDLVSSSSGRPSWLVIWFFFLFWKLKLCFNWLLTNDWRFLFWNRVINCWLVDNEIYFMNGESRSYGTDAVLIYHTNRRAKQWRCPPCLLFVLFLTWE